MIQPLWLKTPPEPGDYTVYISLLFICQCFVCLKSPIGQLKDLVELKDQLEDIQKRMEDEIQVGVPPVRFTYVDT